MERVKVYTEKGMPIRKKVSGFSPLCSRTHFPLLPVEDDGPLNDPKLREHFIELIFVFKRAPGSPGRG